jgi:Domain of unknown function (DUF1990)
VTTASRWVRLRTVLGWPVGIALVSWRYMWRTTPLHRSEEAGGADDLPSLAHQDDGDGRQGLDAGVGPMLHRSYAVRIVNSAMSPAALIEAVAGKLNQTSPEMAVFHKTRGADGALRRGDEFLVRMPGPWDGPVRVVHRDATSFRLATLDGHLEAGEIEFRASSVGGALRFEIESWARAGDRLADLLYNKLRLAKEIQLNMWSHFCVRTAALADGRPQGGVTIRTRWVAWPALPQSRLAAGTRAGWPVLAGYRVQPARGACARPRGPRRACCWARPRSCRLPPFLGRCGRHGLILPPGGTRPAAVDDGTSGYSVKPAD